LSVRAARFAQRAALAMALVFLASGQARAADHKSEAAKEGQESSALVDPKLPRMFDLGEFDLENFRPTHNEIANIKFNLQLALAPGTSEETMAQMAEWRHRLRDQAITAIRTADFKDLAEPKLSRVQKLIMLRLKRMPLPAPVTGVYLTDFAVSSG
jgi:hypothetical protein